MGLFRVGKRVSDKFRLFKRREILAGIAIALSLVSLRIADPSLIETLRFQVFDSYQRYAPRSLNEDPPALVIDIDEKSLDQVGQWPWPRTYVAQMLINVFEDGAAAVGTDVMFSEPDRTSPKRVAESNPYLAEALGDKIDDMPDNDDLFAEIVGQVPVVLGYAVAHENGEDSKGLPRSSVAEIGEDPRRFIPSVGGVIRNIPVLEEAATAVGNYSPIPEQDGVVRRVPLLTRHDDNLLTWLAVETVQAAIGQNTFVVRTVDTGIEEIVVGDRVIPTDATGRMWVHYRNFDKSLYISAADVLSGNFKPGLFEGKIVFLGASAIGLEDLRMLPVGTNLPGVEVHLQTVEMIFDKSFLQRPDFIDGLELLFTIIATLVIVFTSPIIGARATFLILFVSVSGSAYVSWWAYNQHKFLLDASFPIFASIVTYVVMTTLAFLKEEHQKAYVKSAFSQYLSPQLVDDLVKNPEKLRLGGEAKELSILFCDVRGFTSLTETLKDKPQQMTSVINMLMTELTSEILGNGGTVDKYMGDAVMAFWNAPLDDPEHRFNAVKSAYKLQTRMEVVNQKIAEFVKTEGLGSLPFLRIGVGVATGLVTVGNVGSRQRFDYSVIGDAVNLSSRLESQTKQYGVHNLISEATAVHIKDKFALIEVDIIQVKGKSEPIRVFTCFGDINTLQDNLFKTYHERHNAMVSAYRSQLWDDAEQIALECLEFPHAPSELYAMYLDRIETYKKSPPSPDWDGVFVSDQK